MLNISVNQAQGKVPVTVIALEGDLDGSNFQDLIAKAQELQTAGAQNLLIDMAGLRFMSSAGLVALHSIALLMRGEQPPNPEEGWAAFHALSHDRDTATFQPHVKLLNLTPRIDLVLDRTGMNAFFEVHTSLDTAVASF